MSNEAIAALLHDAVEDQGGVILDDAKVVVLEVLAEFKTLDPLDWTQAGADIKKRLKRFFYKIIERRPLILPIIIPV